MIYVYGQNSCLIYYNYLNQLKSFLLYLYIYCIQKTAIYMIPPLSFQYMNNDTILNIHYIESFLLYHHMVYDIYNTPSPLSPSPPFSFYLEVYYLDYLHSYQYHYHHHHHYLYHYHQAHLLIIVFFSSPIVYHICIPTLTLYCAII